MSADAAVAWLRQQVQARLEMARKADTGESWEADRRYGAAWDVDLKPSLGPVASPGDGREASLGIEDCDDFENPRFLSAMVFHAQHIAANDPRDTVARCEAELGILDLHALWAAGPTAHPAMGAAACAVSDAVRHVARAYRHWEGYAEHWGDAG